MHYDLPPPSPTALERSKTLTQVIAQAICANGGVISFDRYMEFTLYHPTLGYYQTPDFNLGAAGDFTTAAEISPLYAQCIAQMITHSQLNAIFEIGAGSGRFAIDLLQALASLDALPNEYLIYEISPALRAKQQALIQQYCPSYLAKVRWLEAYPQQFKGIIIANEVLDALPVTCFAVSTHSLQEKGVSYQGGKFGWQPIDAPLALQAALAPLQQEWRLPVGYQSEIHLTLPAFIQTLSQCLTQGIILFADYGYGAAEYYHPQRKAGTLTCFYRHMHHNNPFIYPGLQDITAHVNFTYLAEAAIKHDLEVLGYTTQAAYLLSNGLMDFATYAEKTMNEADRFKQHQAIKTLTLPTEMGECIKMMALGKNWDQPVSGFGLQDRRRDL